MTICRCLFTDRETEARACWAPHSHWLSLSLPLLRKMVLGGDSFWLDPAHPQPRFQATCFLGSAPW